MSGNNNKGTAYIRSDNRHYENSKEKYIKFFRKILIKVKLETIEDEAIILVPKYKKYGKFIEKRLLKQISSYVNRNEFQGLILEEDLKFLEQKLDNKHILNGKYLMKNLVLKILEYIFNINKQNMSLENIYIFVNKYSKNNIYIIENLISKFKTVNIITENLKYYRRLESSLYNEGVLITVSNNKRKSAKNARYIINMDFEKDTLEKYNINMDSIFINLTEFEGFFENKFRGVLVNNLEVTINQDSEDFIDEFYGKVSRKLYLESYLKSKVGSCEDIERICKEYNVNISRLIGVRGILEEREFML